MNGKGANRLASTPDLRKTFSANIYGKIACLAVLLSLCTGAICALVTALNFLQDSKVSIY